MAGHWPAPRRREWEVDWLHAICAAPRCFSAAALLYDTDAGGAGFPLCVDCADLLLEHEQARGELVAAGSPVRLPHPFRELT